MDEMAQALGPQTRSVRAFYAADRLCCWSVGRDSSKGAAPAVDVRTERTHSDSGHTVSLLSQRGQRVVPVKRISQPTQKSARSSRICP
jgi:hypothetical protein